MIRKIEKGKKEKEKGRTLSVCGLWRFSRYYRGQSRVHRGYPVSPPSRRASTYARTSLDRPNRSPSARASTRPPFAAQRLVCAAGPGAQNSRSRTRSRTRRSLRLWTHCRIPLGRDGAAVGRCSRPYVLWPIRGVILVIRTWKGVWQGHLLAEPLLVSALRF